MNHAPDAVASLNPELVQVGDAIGQRAQRRGLLEGPVRPVGIVKSSYSRNTIIRCRRSTPASGSAARAGNCRPIAP